MKLKYVLVLMNPATLSLTLASAPSFPIVDLGYARHAPTFTNTSQYNTAYATYGNIRFAQAPIGGLRFRGPVTPPPAADIVQNGTLTDPPGINGTTIGSEDCLFLDVIVPEGLDAAAPNSRVPVLHWIYGGGFLFGAKDFGPNPASVLDGMRPDKKFIVVASNYRLGALGWMSSETEPSITPNAGLYDAWAALQWTRQYIHLFGGDPDSVTAMGQSAGGGIIQHLLAADIRGHDVPFSQAFLSSPGYRPHINRSREMTDIYNIFLNGTQCSDVECLRQLPEEAMRKASAYMILEQATGPFGGPSIGFGPIIDGNLVTNNPDSVLADAYNSGHRFTGRIRRVIVGGMKKDGIGNPPSSKWTDLVKMFARTPSNVTVDTIEHFWANSTDLAPASDGLPAQTTFDQFYGDIIYECHAYFAAKLWSRNASPGSCATPKQPTGLQAYRYDESVLPATHGDDLNYYFFDKDIATALPNLNPGLATKFQDYLRSFILGEHLEGWPEYSSQGLKSPSWMNITANGFEPVVGMDESARAHRCEAIVKLLRTARDGW